MPYRRLPNTDKSRLKALSTLLENNELYTVRDRFIDWKDINKAKTAYDKLLTLVNQYEIDKKAQSRGKGRIDKLQRNAVLYMSHFMQVLRMSIERAKSRKKHLSSTLCLTIWLRLISRLYQFYWNGDLKSLPERRQDSKKEADRYTILL